MQVPVSLGGPPRGSVESGIWAVVRAQLASSPFHLMVGSLALLEASGRIVTNNEASTSLLL